VKSRIARFPVSGEINRKVANAAALIADIEARYSSQAIDIDYTDGLSMSFLSGVSTFVRLTQNRCCALMLKRMLTGI
jgi:hypothetical protein